MYQKLLKKNKAVTDDFHKLELEYRDSRQKWVSRESEYRFQVQELLKACKGENPEKRHWRMDQISEMHSCIMDNISGLQTKTTEVLQEQERDLSRSFKGRIDSLIKKLDDKSKPAEETMQWITKCHDLTTELNWIKDMTTKLQADCQQYKDQGRKVQIEHDNLEADREFLIKSLLAVKKENQRLRRGFEEMNSGSSKQYLHTPPGSPRLTKSFSARSFASEPTPRPKSAHLDRRPPRELQRPASASAIVTGSKLSETRYLKTIATMRKRLEAERKRRQALDMRLNKETAEHNELQMFLKQCLADVRGEMESSKGRWGGAMAEGKKARVLCRPHPARRAHLQRPGLQAQDRSRVLELLFSQERVLELLYSQAFPNAAGSKAMKRPAGNLFAGTRTPSSSASSAGFFQDSGRAPISPVASPMARYSKR